MFDLSILHPLFAFEVIMMPSSTVRSSTGMKTVGEIAISVAGALKIFRRIGIDYGDVWEMPLDEALRTRDVDLDAVLAEIAALEATPVSAPADSGELVDYIISHYHQVHRRESYWVWLVAWRRCTRITRKLQRAWRFFLKKRKESSKTI